MTLSSKVSQQRDLSGQRFDLHQTHSFVSGDFTTDDSFPDRDGPIVLWARVEIGSGSTHRGIVFEAGSTARGLALWVADDGIGAHAGAAGSTNGATATYTNPGGNWGDGRILLLGVSVTPGAVQLLLNGDVVARAEASSGGFSGDWADAGDGTVADAPNGTAVSDVPGTSAIAPNGFTLVERLRAYNKQSLRREVA